MTQADDRVSRQAFLDVVAAGAVGSDETLRWYRQLLGQFWQWADREYPDAPLTGAAFNGFIAFLKREERSRATLRGYAVVLRRYGRWLLAEGLTDKDPARNVAYPPKMQRRPKGVAPGDFEKLLGQASTLRDKALLLLLWETGARADELIGLTWQAVDLDKRRAWVTGKGSKDRPVFLCKDGAAALGEYRPTIPHNPVDRVLWALDGASPLTYWGMYLAVRRMGDKAGVDRCNPHAFRHGFGRRLSKNGCPTLVLQDLMGHASPEVTRLYTFLDEEDLAQLHERYAGGE